MNNENNPQNSNPNPMQPNNNNDMMKLMIPISILLGCIIIAVALFFGLNATSKGTVAGPTVGTQQQNPTSPVDIKNVTTQGEPFIGSANAPVTIAYWSDYQCPFCMQFETTTFKQLLTNYVNTGKVKIIFKDFEFLGPDSTADALYARAVWALYPNQYNAWREKMYATQPRENSLSVADNQARLTKITSSISGIDANKVAAAVTTNTAQYQKAIDVDMSEGTSFGVQGTPTFIVGTQLFSGGSSYSQFSQLIDPQLK